MVKLDNCTHMEIKKVYGCDVVKSGKKIVFEIDLGDIHEPTNPRMIQISISNGLKLLELFEIQNFKNFVGKEIKCMVSDAGITFVSPLVFEDQSADDYVFCKEFQCFKC